MCDRGRIVFLFTYRSVALKRIRDNVRCLHFLQASSWGGGDPWVALNWKWSHAPLSSSHKVRKGKAGKELWGGRGGWWRGVGEGGGGAVFILGFPEWGWHPGRPSDEQRIDLSLLISKLRHVPHWGASPMSDGRSKAVGHQRGTPLISSTFQWFAPVHRCSLSCVRENENAACRERRLHREGCWKRSVYIDITGNWQALHKEYICHSSLMTHRYVPSAVFPLSSTSLQKHIAKRCLVFSWTKWF